MVNVDFGGRQRDLANTQHVCFSRRACALARRRHEVVHAVPVRVDDVREPPLAQPLHDANAAQLGDVLFRKPRRGREEAGARHAHAPPLAAACSPDSSLAEF